MKHPLLIGLVLAGAFSCGTSSELQLDGSTIPLASNLEGSWLDCTVSTPRFRQHCKLSARVQPVLHDLQVTAPTEAVQRILAGEDGSSVAALVPRLRFVSRWEGPARCWAWGPPTNVLRVVSGEAVVGLLNVGTSTIEVLLRDAHGRPLWSLDVQAPGHTAIETAFRLVDDAPSPYPDGRSPRPYPLECDLRLTHIEVGYDLPALAKDLRHARTRQAVSSRLLLKEKLLHTQFAQGNVAGLCFIHHTASALLDSERRHTQRPDLGWDQLPDEVQEQIGDLVLEASKSGITPALAPTVAATGWRHFLDNLTERPTDCGRELVLGEPSPERFLREGVVLHMAGYQNALDYMQDAARHRQNENLIAALMAASGKMEEEL